MEITTDTVLYLKKGVKLHTTTNFDVYYLKTHGSVKKARFCENYVLNVLFKHKNRLSKTCRKLEISI